MDGAAGLGRNAVIFQDLDTRAICEQLFAAYPQALFRFDVQQTLPARAITTQYRESDWDFATRIDILAQQKIVLQAGRTSITLEGGNITFACPGTFTVKAGQHPFMGGNRTPPICRPCRRSAFPRRHSIWIIAITMTKRWRRGLCDHTRQRAADARQARCAGPCHRPDDPRRHSGPHVFPMAGLFGRNDMTPTPTTPSILPQPSWMG